MNIRVLKEFDLGINVHQVRSLQLHISPSEPEYTLFGYSESDNMDPWEEYLRFPGGKMHFALYGAQGQRIWHREFGPAVIPGVWFCPFVAFDLDQDGMDEIYFVHNTADDKPFSARNSVLDKIDPRTGETMATYPFPAINTVNEPLTHAYRQNMVAGYGADGAPVLITAQGTYGDMFLQAYNSDMSMRWERVIAADEPGPRSSHAISVFDYDNDGVDEVFWGERIFSIDNGKDKLVCGKDDFNGHSDIVLPFYDEQGAFYLYTMREDKDYVGCWRVVTYDKNGNVVWRDVQSEVSGWNTNHMHNGWMMRRKSDGKRIVTAVKTEAAASHIPAEIYVFDALTGERMDLDLPFSINECVPFDVNGDGFSEFFSNGVVYDADGNVLVRTGGERITTTKLYDYAGEQLLCFYPGTGKVLLWGDADAQDGEFIKKRYENGYLKHMTQLTGAGYNTGYTVTTAM